MKMKKFFALLLAMVMVVAMATGCSKKSAGKTSGGDVAGSSATVTLSLKATSENGSVDFSLVEKVSGKSMSVSLSGKANTEEVKLDGKADDLFVLANGKFYVNVKSILDLATNSDVEEAEEAVAMVKELIKEDYLYMEIPGLNDVLQTADVSMMTEMMDSVMAAYQGISKTTGDVVTIEVANQDDLKLLIDATVKLVNDNAEKYADYVVDSYNKIDMNKLVDTIVDALVDNMIDTYKQTGMEVTSEMKNQAKDMVKAQLDTSEMKVSKDDILGMIKEMTSELAEMSENIEEFELKDMTVNLVISKLPTGYTVVGTAKSELASMELSATMDTVTPVVISAPSKAQNVQDIIGSIAAIAGAKM